MLLHLSLVCLLGFMSAQSNNSAPIWNVLLPNSTVAGSKHSFAYQWVAYAGATRVMNNVSAELMFGKAEDNGNDVADIIRIQMPQSTSVDYYFRPTTPPGNYHVRLNGTVGDLHEASPGAINDLVLDSPVFNATARTPTFSVVPASTAFPCATPTFTPVRSLSDPAYAPVRVAGPQEGSVMFMQNPTALNPNWDRLISVDFVPMDWFSYYEYQEFEAPVGLSLELVNTATGGSAGVFKQKAFTWLNINSGGNFMDVSNFTLSPGAWKIRANYTWLSAAISTLSDEFYIASEPPCGGIGNNPSSPSGTPSAGASSSDKVMHLPGWGWQVLALIAALTMLMV
ncbi:hypothetical protein DFH09DRAFT_1360973 [Mycena vulgaris]|nr:hypothetical protein DFH09DRAFT_1360973 [Mycena vulgaris]